MWYCSIHYCYSVKIWQTVQSIISCRRSEMCLHKIFFKTVIFPVVMPFEWLKFGKKDIYLDLLFCPCPAMCQNIQKLEVPWMTDYVFVSYCDQLRLINLTVLGISTASAELAVKFFRPKFTLQSRQTQTPSSSRFRISHTFRGGGGPLKPIIWQDFLHVNRVFP